MLTVPTIPSDVNTLFAARKNVVVTLHAGALFSISMGRVCEVRWTVQILFRSVNKLLMDTATSEYLFCCDFFQEDTVFSELFAATLAVVESALGAQLQVQHSPIAITRMPCPTNGFCPVLGYVHSHLGSCIRGVCRHLCDSFWLLKWFPVTD
jgi:hypothetical protein